MHERLENYMPSPTKVYCGEDHGTRTEEDELNVL